MIVIVPAEGWLIVEPIEWVRETTTPSGLALPESTEPEPTVRQGKIIGFNTDIHLNMGDTIYYSRYEGVPFKQDGKEYIFLQDDKYLGVERERVTDGPYNED